MADKLRSRHERVPATGTRLTPRETIPSGSQNRLRRLLVLLAVTTLLLLAYQVWRFQYKRDVQLHNAHERSAADVMKTTAAPETDGDNVLPVQFDEDGEMDLGTLQRMLDILYKRPMDPEGLEKVDAGASEYHFRKLHGNDASSEPVEQSTIAGYL